MLLLTGVLYTANTLMASDVLCREPKKYIVQDNAQKSTYENCKRNGMTWWYKDDGSIKSQVNFIDGKENGLYTSYHTNGKKKIVVNYVNAQKDGIQKIYYDHSGKVIKTETYKMDRNPVMVRLLKDKRKEILVDLSKYGLMPKDAPAKDRIR